MADDDRTNMAVLTEQLLQGRTCLVTGAGGGVGAGLAAALAAAGANVVLAVRRVDTGEEVVARIRGLGGHASAVECDVGVEADVQGAVACAVETYGGLDTMVHNALATVGPPERVESMPDETWDRMIRTAVRASFYCARAAHPHLVARGGSMILLTSATGIGRTSLRRIGDPAADIGPVAVFLASDLGRYVTGQTIVADGGGYLL